MIKRLSKSGLFSVILVVILYSAYRMIKSSPSMPSFDRIFDSALKIFSSKDFYMNLLYTIKIVLSGVLISFLFGVSVAVICFLNEWLNGLIMPLVNFTKNIPSIALFPLFIVLMGIGDTPRIFIIIWNSIYPIISSTFVGLNSPDKEVIEAAQVDGATKWGICIHMRMPIATLDILNGLKISIGNGFIAIVVAEMLGATKGLGYMVLWSANAFQYSDMYVYIGIIALIGFLINFIIEKAIKKAERRIYYESKKNYCNDARFGTRGGLFLCM